MTSDKMTHVNHMSHIARSTSRRRAVTALAAATALAGAGAGAGAAPTHAVTAVSAAKPAASVAGLGATPLAARGFGGARGGFGRSTRSSRPRSTPTRTSAQRRAADRRAAQRRRSIGRSSLQALGIAFLLNALFGWGAGGSPIGLLLVLAFIVWLVTRRGRRAHRPRWT
jgi:hypothetical protein